MKFRKTFQEFFGDFPGFVLGICVAFISFFLIDLIFKGKAFLNLETISTITSVVLSIVSIVYTYVSGGKTSRLLDDLEHDVKSTVGQNKTLVSEIHSKEIESNFDEQNITKSYSAKR